MKNLLLKKVLEMSRYVFIGLVLQMITITILLAATSSTAQQKSLNEIFISINVQNSPVQEVFKQLENYSGLRFAYNHENLIGAARIHLKVKNESLFQVLESISQQSKLKFKRINENIHVSKLDQDDRKAIEEVIQNLQNRTINGKVTTFEDGEPLPGVNVVEKGTSNGTVTSLDGEYTLTVSEEATLVFSSIGFTSEEVAIGDQSIINMVMTEDIQQLQELVVVGYGTQKKADISGSVATVDGEELAKAKVASTRNAIAGRFPGVVSLQTSGEPGRDAASLNIRGFGSPLVIVDGIQRDFNDINPEEIESVTVLKDASAAIYGARAGNGVILVTTKRGENSKPVISLNSTYTLQGLTAFPDAVNSGQYAELMNELSVNDGGDPVFTEEEVQKYYDGSDRTNFPNSDWWGATMNNWSPQLQLDASVRGGNDNVKYFALLSQLDQQGMYKSGDNEYKRYNLRSNLDANISRNLSATLDLSMIAEDLKSPIRSVNNIWQDFYGALPTFSTHLPDPTRVAYGGSVPVSPIASTTFDIGGYNAARNTELNMKGSIKYEIPFVDGLSLEAFGSYFQDEGRTKVFQRQYSVYEYDAQSDTYIDRGSTFRTSLNQGSRLETWFTTQLSSRYQRTFNNEHNFEALFLFEQIDQNIENINATGENFLTDAIDYLFAAGGEGQTVGGSAFEDGRDSFIGRINYNYKGKYYVQGILRHDGSPRFASEQRWGTFPSISFAWRMSDEPFIANNIEFLDNLKLRASYSQLGNDATGNFQYLSGYQIATGSVGPRVNSGYVIDGAPLPGLVSTGLSNPFITWENMEIYNLGLDFDINNSILYGELDAFYRNRTGILATRFVSLPNTFGADLPAENLNSQTNRGFELLIGHKNRIGDLSYSLSGNISWNRAKWDQYDEPDYEDPDDIRIRQRSGQWVNRVFGFRSDGIFTSQEEIDNLPFDQDQSGNTSLAPGDIKYVDLNEDGVLDFKDQEVIARTLTPELMFGVNMNLNYKGIDVSMLWQGAGRRDVQISSGIMPASDRTPYTFVYENRWTEENNDANSILPRISGKGNVNNGKHSDFWYVDGTYLRLRNINVGYTIPSGISEKVGVGNLRVYFTGTNLLTFSKLNKYDYDPEGPSGSRSWYYPQQKTVAFGLSIKI